MKQRDKEMEIMREEMRCVEDRSMHIRRYKERRGNYRNNGGTFPQFEKILSQKIKGAC